MSVRTTDPANVALFDSTTMQAFGPLFESADHAEDFVAWMTTTWGVQRLSALPASTLGKLHGDWTAARCDDDGYLLETAP